MKIRMMTVLTTLAVSVLFAMPGNAQPVVQDGKPTSDDANLQKKAPQYEDLATVATKKLIEKDRDGFLKIMDQGLIERIGAQKFSKMVDVVFIPFFADYDKSAGSMTVCAAKDADGKMGLSFYPCFQTKGGELKYYSVTIMEKEQGHPKVAVLLPNRKFTDDHPDVDAERRKNGTD